MRSCTVLMFGFEANVFDYGAAQASPLPVQHRGLTGRGCALRRLELDPGTAIGANRHSGRLFGLAITQLYRDIEVARAPVTQPVERRGGHRAGLEPMLLMSLHHDQCVALAVFLGDIPGLVRAAARTADREPGALTQRVERQAAMLPQRPSVERFDRYGSIRQVAAQKLSEWPFADEADNRAVWGC